MNDFTIEELQDLSDCCNPGIHDDHPWEDWKQDLQIKIQGMLTNYCVHEWEMYLSPFGNIVRCNKCNKSMQGFLNDS